MVVTRRGGVVMLTDHPPLYLRPYRRLTLGVAGDEQLPRPIRVGPVEGVPNVADPVSSAFAKVPGAGEG